MLVPRVNVVIYFYDWSSLNCNGLSNAAYTSRFIVADIEVKAVFD